MRQTANNDFSKENTMWIRATAVLMLCGAAAGFGALAVGQPAAANAQNSRAMTPLGDLSTYRAIAVDTLGIVGTGDFAAAKKRIKDLELSWDRAEAKMKPLAPEKWTTVDVAIDRALKEVRAWRATQASSSEALQALISTIDAVK